MQLDLFPKMVQNWTSKIKVFITPNIEIESSYQNDLSKLNIPVYRGIIAKVNHNSTKVGSVILESGEHIQVGTLLWIPPVKPIQLIQRLVENLGLELKNKVTLRQMKSYKQMLKNFMQQEMSKDPVR
jgi:uncharacterized protein YaaR (DUF327 family)